MQLNVLSPGTGRREGAGERPAGNAKGLLAWQTVSCFGICRILPAYYLDIFPTFSCIFLTFLLEGNLLD